MGTHAKRKVADRSPDLTDFKTWAKRLRRAYKKASRKEGKAEATLRPRQRAPAAFKLLAYRYLRQLKQRNLIWELQAYVEERDGSQWKGHGEGDELWVLRLATEGEQTDKKRATRRRWAPELRLADLNDVEPDLLLGFLHEAGPGELIKQDAGNAVRYEWAECYRAKAAPKRAATRPESKVARKKKDDWD